MSAHTSTPWTLTTVQTSCGVCHKIGPFPPKPGTTRENYACVYADYPGNGPHDAELLANARLMFAAPDLLAALKEARESVQANRDIIYECHYEPHTGDVDAEGRVAVDEEDALLSRIDVAIAKATGVAS